MKIYCIGIGPGGEEQMTMRAIHAIEKCDCVAGYPLYLELIENLLQGKERIATPMKKEVARCEAARDAALQGKTVAMVSSGDAGVYGMAGVLHEVCAAYPEIEIEVIPGVTAACAGAAVLGAPLISDFAVISLSDLLTPWEKIENRLRAAAQGDFVICLYNPMSQKRIDHLRRACDYILEHRAEDTPCGTVHSIGREGEHGELCTLKELRDKKVDMFTTIIIGNSQTKVIHGKLVTPRGYREV